MADISLFEDDYEDSGGDGTDSELGYNYDSYGTDYHLTPIQKMEKYMESDNGYHRTMVARNLTDTLRWMVETESEADAQSILDCIARLSEDVEATVRLELMDQIPHIATYVHENQEIFGNKVDFMSNYVVPITARYLTDDHHLIRKTCQAALLVLLEQELINKDDFEEQICPVILESTSSENAYDELKIEAIALMSKMAPLVGPDITIRMFMDRFTELCTDTLFHVRKVCASNFGDICSVVGQEKTETVLLPKFKSLCEDRIWGIRRSCAECFMEVSCCVSREARERELSSLFLQLLGDVSSRWVRQAAFQALGLFISTFADPKSTGLYFNNKGVFLVAGNQGNNPSPTQSTSPSPTQSSETQAETPSSTPPNTPSNPSTQPQENSEASEKEKSEVQENNNSSGDCDCNAAAASGLESSQEAPNSPGQASAPEDQFEAANKSHNAGTSDNTSDTSVEEMEIDTELEGAASVSLPAENELSLEESRAQHLADSSNCAHSGSGDSTSSIISSDSNETASENTASALKVPSSQLSSDSEAENNQRQSQSKGGAKKQSSATESFNSFQYWREPLLDIDVESDIKSTEADQSSKDLTMHSAESAMLYSTEGTSSSGAEDLSVHMANLNSLDDQPEYVANIGSTHVLGQHVSETTMTVINGVVQDIGSQNIHWETTSSEDDTPEEGHNFRRDPETRKQDVVPQSLLEHYLSMTDNVHIQTTDQDIARHCAYSFPAVAKTLGRKFWLCLQELYETLASDMQWKVRRTLAFSIHELAVILGEDITNDDLVPVFNGFLKDLDEVRIGVLKHFADFLKLLKQERRQEYLAKIPEFLNVDNNRNWRFREELACQLAMLTKLFSAQDCKEHLFPVAILLAEDKVAVVRKTAFRVLAAVLHRFSEEDEANKDSRMVALFLEDVISRFAQSNRWSQRQIYAQLCEVILEEDALCKEQFAKEFLPDLLTLAEDAIPNVRIAVAKVLRLHVLRSEYFTSPSNPEHERLITIQQKLQSDKDRDVRYFIQDNYETSITSSQDQMIPV